MDTLIGNQAQAPLLDLAVSLALPGFVVGFMLFFRVDAEESPWRLITFAVCTLVASVAAIFSARLLTLEIGALLLFREDLLLWLGLLKLQPPGDATPAWTMVGSRTSQGHAERAPPFRFESQPHTPSTRSKILGMVVRGAVAWLTAFAVTIWGWTFQQSEFYTIMGGFISGFLIAVFICSRFSDASK